MTQPSADIPEGIPPSQRDAFVECMEDRQIPVDVLREQIHGYLERMVDALAEHHLLDRELAELIAERYLALFERFDEFEESERRLVQAGVRYFVDRCDADDDFTSIVGFEDDREVLNAVAEAVGCPDKTIDW